MAPDETVVVVRLRRLTPRQRAKLRELVDAELVRAHDDRRARSIRGVLPLDCYGRIVELEDLLQILKED